MGVVYFVQANRARSETIKATRLTVKRINKKTGILPTEAEERHLILLQVKDGKVVNRVQFFAYKTSTPIYADAYTHYVILPNFLC